MSRIAKNIINIPEGVTCTFDNNLLTVKGKNGENSLKINDNPYPDAGIEQTWELAHPNNKKFTGHLPKFKKMIYSKDYKILLNHISHEIEILLESNSTYVFKVKVKTKQNEIYFYEWQITKVKYDKLLKGCWMTSSVSRPNLVGEQV